MAPSSVASFVDSAMMPASRGNDSLPPVPLSSERARATACSPPRHRCDVTPVTPAWRVDGVELHAIDALRRLRRGAREQMSSCWAAPLAKPCNAKRRLVCERGIGRTMRCRRVTLLLHDGWYVAIICAAKILLPLCSCAPPGLELGAPETSHISTNLPTSAKTAEGEVPMALTLSL